MKTNSLSFFRCSFSAILGICLLNLSANAVTEEHLSKQFTVKAGGSVVVDVDMGSIEVATNANGVVAIDVLRKIGRSKKADEESFLKDHPVEFSQEGDKVTIRCRSKNKISWSITGKNQNEVKYTITVPCEYNAQLKTCRRRHFGY
jgi:hypothetical protein